MIGKNNRENEDLNELLLFLLNMKPWGIAIMEITRKFSKDIYYSSTSSSYIEINMVTLCI